MVNRRIFLKSSGMAMVTLGFAPSFLARTAEAAGTRRKLLIAIFQRGAVDGLNMIVPYGEADYYRVRPTIAAPILSASAQFPFACSIRNRQKPRTSWRSVRITR